MAKEPKLKRAKLGPGEFEITCPHCRKVHKRGMCCAHERRADHDMRRLQQAVRRPEEPLNESQAIR